VPGAEKGWLGGTLRETRLVGWRTPREGYRKSETPGLGGDGLEGQCKVLLLKFSRLLTGQLDGFNGIEMLLRTPHGVG